MLELDHEDECPEDMVRAMCGDELGVQLLFIPEEYGGMGGGASTSTASASGWPASTSASRPACSRPSSAATRSSSAATPEQKKKWLGRIAEEGMLFAYGATEPEAGSDLGALRTTAVPVLEDGAGRRLQDHRPQAVDQQRRHRRRVHRSWRTRPAGRPGSCVEHGAEGFTPRQAGGQARHPAVEHGGAVPRRRATSPPRTWSAASRARGSIQAQEVFGYTRLMVAAFGLGGGWAALDRAIAYSTQRVQAGAPLSRSRATRTS